ncbi:SDR family NAD(P)-dependent oxidoreductase [Alphaproteobacteria bacterium]|nr:SDR family NAD(P)-dependent oxidoreductase [Alphaproteobacteria bacterium]
MLSNKNIIVTGSSSGIGLSITKTLLKNKANVLGISRRSSNFLNKNYQHIEFDLSKIDSEFEKLNNFIKEKPIHGLISNAGTGKLDSLENFSPKQISEFINLNLNSHIIITRLLLPYFKTNNKGFLIYIGSEASYKVGKYGSIYSACKFGLRGFVKSIRIETSSKNIKVTQINPGIVKTPFYKNLKIVPGEEYDEFIEPNDIAKIVIDILKIRSGTVIDEINLTPQKKFINFKSNL